jgi:hypothetical protein
MKITATEIARWAETTKDRSSLPGLVRKLIHLVAALLLMEEKGFDALY